MTVGHGTLGAPELVDLLRRGGIETVADVRRYPGSRRHPHFARDALSEWLTAAGIGYRWFESLGGRRKPDESSPNTGLRSEQFRGYADHMASDEFSRAIADLCDLADDRPVAVMCAESVWWRCHRRLLADHLVLVEGRAVDHLFHDGRVVDHEPTPGARVDGGVVTYRPVVEGATLFDAPGR